MPKPRDPIACLVILASGFASLISAAPAITSVQNAASNILLPLPNAAIAVGSIFVVKGGGLGPPNISIASKPFQSATLSGTSVAITSGGKTVDGLMYYTSDSQIAALLPSNTTVGVGTVTVTYNGETSPSVPFNVGFRNLGIFTLDSSGQGPAIVTYPDYSLVSALKSANCGGPNTACGAANPGDTLILWGTGLGPVPPPGLDATGAGLGQDMPAVSLTLWIGGIQAPILYRGRSGCCIGEDQIVFTVPDNVPTGCAVPLAGLISAGGVLSSNSTVMPVAPKGSRDCPPNLQTGSASLLQDALAGRPANFAEIDLTKPVVGQSISPLGREIIGDSDRVDFTLTRLLTPGMAPFLGSFIEDHPTGTCLTYNPASNTRHNLPLANVAGLDAGTSFSITGPNGNKSVSGNASGGFGETLDAAGAYLTPGAYMVSGTGGNDVGAFTANVTVPSMPQLTAPILGNSINRADGYTVTWTGGTPGARLRILLGFNAAAIECYASAADGTFTIPSYALYSIPPLLGGHQLLVNVVASGTFTATGLNLGVINASGPPDGRFPVDVH